MYFEICIFNFIQLIIFDPVNKKPLLTMEVILKSQKYCQDIAEDHPVDNWINEKTTNRTFKFALFKVFPDLFFNEVNSTHYRWCGPLLAFAEYYTKMTKTKSFND